MSKKTQKIKLEGLKKIINNILNELDYGSIHKGEHEYRSKIEGMFSEFNNKQIGYYLYGRYKKANTTVAVQVSPQTYLGDKKNAGDELNVMDTHGTFNVALSLRLNDDEQSYVILYSGYKGKQIEMDFEIKLDKLPPETVELIKEFIKRAGRFTNLSEDLMISALADLDNRVYSEDSDYNYPVDEAVSELKLEPQRFVNENNKKTKLVTVDELKRIVEQLKKKS